ncbi:MAG: hypothetical protein QMA99_08865 [Flavobacterium sp.]
MTDFIVDFKITNYSSPIYNDINIEKGIINFRNSINTDFTGLCTHGKTGLDHFFIRSISEDSANHSARIVITFKI